MNDITPLINACLSGDKESWNSLFREYSPLALHFLTRKFGTLATDDHHDIIQNVFTRLIQYGLKNFQGTSRNSFVAYFTTMVRNEALTYLASERAMTNALVVDQGAGDSDDELPTYEIPDHSMRPDRAVENQEIVELVQHALKETPLVLQQVFMMKSTGSKDREIAESLNIPMGTVAQNYSRVKEKVRRFIEGKYFGRKTPVDRS